MQTGRRQFVLGAALAAALPLRAAGSAYPFSLGVASGSPLPDSVILWTRILADPLNAASTPPLAFTVRWEVAHDQAFRQVVARGSASALAPVDVCNSAVAQFVKVFDGKSCAVGIVGGDGSKTDLRECPTDRHESDLGCDGFETGRREPAAGNDDAVDARRKERIESA